MCSITDCPVSANFSLPHCYIISNLFPSFAHCLPCTVPGGFAFGKWKVRWSRYMGRGRMDVTVVAPSPNGPGSFLGWVPSGLPGGGDSTAIWPLQTHVPVLLFVIISPPSRGAGPSVFPNSSQTGLIRGVVTCGRSVGSAWERGFHK